MVMFALEVSFGELSLGASLEASASISFVSLLVSAFSGEGVIVDPTDGFSGSGELSVEFSMYEYLAYA